MKLNWVMVGLLFMNAVVWYSVFMNGFFITLLWVVIISCIIGIIFKIKEMRV